MSITSLINAMKKPSWHPRHPTHHQQRIIIIVDKNVLWTSQATAASMMMSVTLAALQAKQYLQSKSLHEMVQSLMLSISLQHTNTLVCHIHILYIFFPFLSSASSHWLFRFSSVSVRLFGFLLVSNFLSLFLSDTWTIALKGSEFRIEWLCLQSIFPLKLKACLHCK